MRLFILTVSLWALAYAKPEMYREKEDFQFSRSSSDDGNKQGYYGAQRGNMGGNFEKAHNMDSLAQHQMSSLVRQVDGELGEGAKTRTGSVFTAGNSRGVFGSGHYDLSNLKGRNFDEGESYDKSQLQSSSLLSQNSGYSDNLYSTANNARYSASQLRDLGYTRNSAYQSAALASQRASQFDNQQVEGQYSGSDKYEYGGQGASNYKYYSHGGSQSRNEYDHSNTNLYDLSNHDANARSRLVSTRPVRLYVRPGNRIIVPIAAQTFEGSQNSLVQDQHIADSEAELISNSGQRINVVKPLNKAKHYESSYRYHKEWEKHDNQPLTVIPTENPFSINSELYEDAQSSRAAEQNYQSEVASTNSQSSSRNSAYSNNVKSDYSSGYNAMAKTAASNQLQYQSQMQGSANSANINAYPLGMHSSDSSSNLNSLIDNSNSRPKSYQSSYSYHKSWERRGDPYIIQPVGSVTNGQTSQRLVSASAGNNLLSSHYGSHYGQLSQTHDNCDEEGQIHRRKRSYNLDQYQHQMFQTNHEELGQQSVNGWGSDHDKTQGRWENLEYVGQQTQNNWNELENLGQKPQTPWGNLEHLGQETQTNWDNLESLNQYPQNTFENLSQQTQNQLGNLEDLGQQTQNKWDNLESLNQQSGLHDLGQHSQSQFDNLEDLGQQTQNKWDNLESLNQQSGLHDLGQHSQNQFDNLEDLGQQTQNKWDNLESLNQQSGLHDLGQHSQSQFDNLEDLGQQTQNKWDNFESLNQQSGIHDLGQHSQSQFDNLEDLGQQTQNKWDNMENSNQQSQTGLEDFTQQTQNQDNLEDLGQQTQNKWDNMENSNQQSQTGLEDFSQQTQNQENLKDLGQQTQNKWDNMEISNQQAQIGLEDFTQQTQNQNNLENLGQQTQNKWDNMKNSNLQSQTDLEDFNQQTQNQNNLKDLGQQTQNKWDNMENSNQPSQTGLEDFTQQTQKQNNLEDLGQQIQNQWGKLENLGQQTQSQWEKFENLGQQTQTHWDKLEQLSPQLQGTSDSQQTQNTWHDNKDQQISNVEEQVQNGNMEQFEQQSIPDGSDETINLHNTQQNYNTDLNFDQHTQFNLYEESNFMQTHHNHNKSDKHRNGEPIYHQNLNPWDNFFQDSISNYSPHNKKPESNNKPNFWDTIEEIISEYDKKNENKDNNNFSNVNTFGENWKQNQNINNNDQNIFNYNYDQSKEEKRLSNESNEKVETELIDHKIRENKNSNTEEQKKPTESKNILTVHKVNPFDIGRGDIGPEEIPTLSVEPIHQSKEKFEDSYNSFNSDTAYKTQKEIESLSLINENQNEGKLNQEPSILNVMGLEHQLQLTTSSTNKPIINYNSNTNILANNDHNISPTNIVNNNENIEQQNMKQEDEFLGQERSEIPDQSLIDFGQQIQTPFNNDMQQYSQQQFSDFHTKFTHEKENVQKQVAYENQNQELLNGNEKREFYVENLPSFPTDQHQTPELSEILQSPASYNKPLYTQQELSDIHTSFTHVHNSENIQKPSVEQNKEPLIEDQIVKHNVDNQQSVPKNQDIILTPAEPTDKPGFWKSLWGKTVDAKERVVSWFKS